MIFFQKKPQFYKGLLIKADLGLHDQIASFIKSNSTHDCSILDWGAGEGALSLRLHDMGYNVIAVDKDNVFKCEDIPFSILDFNSTSEIDKFISAHNNQFDIVLSTEVIEHIQDQWNYIGSLLAMLKPGGLIIITTPNITSWLSRIQFFFSGMFHQFTEEDLSYGHIHPITPQQLSFILKESGASHIEIRSAGTLPPIYLTGLNKISLLNLLVLPLRCRMKGILDGWCILASARKPQ